MTRRGLVTDLAAERLELDALDSLLAGMPDTNRPTRNARRARPASSRLCHLYIRLDWNSQGRRRLTGSTPEPARARFGSAFALPP